MLQQTSSELRILFNINKLKNKKINLFSEVAIMMATSNIEITMVMPEPLC